MSYKNILLQVDGDKNMPARAAAALQLAAQFNAHITGLHVAPPMYIPPMMVGQVGDIVMEVNEKIRVDAESKAKAQFAKLEANASTPVEWRTDQGHGGSVVAMHARYADLAVLSQYDPEGEAANYYPDLVENVVLDCGRPVLIVPFVGKFPKIGSNILVAWNASREATRAVTDALPLLKTADKVTVLVINAEGGADGHGDIPGADIALYLSRHGVKAEAASLVAKDIDVGSMLLSRAADLGVDLLVMGAYGRSRLREFIMGGASRDILRYMTVPVLMSH
ncbi:MAG: universal stress protein [Alphaproteobacteria bacterium]